MQKRTQKDQKILPDDIVDDEDSATFVVTCRKAKKTETISLEMPRNPFKNPETTAMMDRLKLTPAQSMGFSSTIMKTATINHNTVDLNEFTCSPRTIGRSRNKNRGVLFQLALDEFKRSKSEHCNIHWDGKQLTSCLGVVDECEAIMVSGSVSYIEGKLLAVARLTSST